MAELSGATFDTAQKAMLTSENSHSSLKCEGQRGTDGSPKLTESAAILPNVAGEEYLRTAIPVASDEIGRKHKSTNCSVFCAYQNPRIVSWHAVWAS